MRKIQRGFTLIELVMVIVILGILAAVALPKFMDNQSDARAAKLQGALGAVNSATGMAHSAALTRSTGVAAGAVCAGGANALTDPALLSTVGTGDLCTEGGNIAMTNGYPAGALNGIVLASGLQTAGGVPTVLTLAAAGWTVAVAGTTVTFQPVGAPTPASCQFTYTSAAAVGAPPVISAATITGC